MIDKIVIVGGGSSGWISASFLAKTFPDKEIVVVESPDIPTVGVGESTLADVTNFRDYLGINEEEFMKATDASYKMSIKFTDFYDVNSGGFHYPFRTPDTTDTVLGLLDWMEIKAFYPETPVTDFVDSFFPHAQLFNQNKFNHNKFGLFGNWNPNSDVAYHFDATKFGAWLRDGYAIPRGVKLITANVLDATLNDSGIETLILNTGETITADLFVDCTGFKSMLLNGYLKEPFKDYGHMLPNNRAWAVQLPYKDKENELEPFTNCTAHTNGWVWNIPLWSRLGTGYVYSDKYISKEDALEEFKLYLMSDKMIVPRTKEDIENLSFKDIPMRIGIHERTWVKNVVALGLSASFIEPLESNGLFSVFWFVTQLSKSLLRKEVSQLDRDIYNASNQIVFNNLAEFISMHYALSVRRDSSYWLDISTREFSTDLKSKEVVTTTGYQNLVQTKMFNGMPQENYGITYISTGMNYGLFDRVDQKLNIFNRNVKPYVDANVAKFAEKKARWAKAAEKSPSLYQYLKEKYYE